MERVAERTSEALQAQRTRLADGVLRGDLEPGKTPVQARQRVGLTRWVAPAPRGLRVLALARRSAVRCTGRRLVNAYTATHHATLPEQAV